MEARKCDRCGKLYEKYHMETGIRGDMRQVNGFRLTFNGEFLNPFKDLCPECMAALLTWFKNGKEREKE